MSSTEINILSIASSFKFNFTGRLLQQTNVSESGVEQNRIMNWNTLYVKGNRGFEEEVLYNLEHSRLVFMPGSVTGLSNVSLFWVDEKATLRDFKKAIGAKTVFKYRLLFFSTLEEVEQLDEKTTPALTSQEAAMIRKMEQWDEDHDVYKHSA
jgi:hypothetical protein